MMVSKERTGLCTIYHGDPAVMGECVNGENCLYIHMKEYKGTKIPKNLYCLIQNENRRKNLLEAVRMVQPDIAEKMEKGNIPNHDITNYIDAHNLGI